MACIIPRWVGSGNSYRRAAGPSSTSCRRTQNARISRNPVTRGYRGAAARGQPGSWRFVPVHALPPGKKELGHRDAAKVGKNQIIVKHPSREVGKAKAPLAVGETGLWSGRRDSNPRQSAWKADLRESPFRALFHRFATIKFSRHWGRRDAHSWIIGGSCLTGNGLGLSPVDGG